MDIAYKGINTSTHNASKKLTYQVRKFEYFVRLIKQKSLLSYDAGFSMF